MKGISPLVAVIMLIAFTLIVAGILAGFVTQLTETQRASAEHCVDARVLLKKGTYTAADDSLKLTIYNYGKVPLRLQALLTYSNETLHPQGTYIHNETFDVSNGKIELFTINGVKDDLIEVTVKSVKCDPPCYECPAAQDFLKYTDIKGIGY